MGPMQIKCWVPVILFEVFIVVYNWNRKISEGYNSHLASVRDIRNTGATFIRGSRFVPKAC